MFFEYSQNNSGGSFANSGDVANYVIVEAPSASVADAIAGSKGLYFYGDGDCPCCGPRWSTAWGEGDPVPSHYEEPIIDFTPVEIDKESWTQCVIHYLDGKSLRIDIK